MTARALPVDQAFATGSHGATLVLMVCASWVWAGLYASPFSQTPVEVSAATGLVATVRGRNLHIGAGHFPLSSKSLQSARRWLDRQGVRVRDTTAKESA
ncbi:hypothetical protein [Stenotrophomonas nematodicola]|uniref:hypothetical protein n=1 Tax=Stenotrophomonas nematodicola TaxID=2656746 RepID=UPI001291351F|nr:hypothetical protein [Stenotrophomonas nematodicola]